jgi:hypothetical protein
MEPASMTIWGDRRPRQRRGDGLQIDSDIEAGIERGSGGDFMRARASDLHDRQFDRYWTISQSY